MSTDPRVPGPGSLTWRFAGDPRILGAAGYALILQLAHPTVAAGVNDHSDYQNAPWTRLMRSVDYLFVMAFGGEAAARATAAKLRERHESIKGPGYSAFEPEAWNWVQATLADAAITGIEHFGRPITTAQRDGLWAEFRDVGALVGANELPPTWSAYLRYRDEMIATRLSHDSAIDEFLETLDQQPGGRLAAIGAVGLLPSALRLKLGLSWTHRKQGQLEALGKAHRALTPVMRGPLRNAGPLYLRLRGLPQPDHGQ